MASFLLFIFFLIIFVIIGVAALGLSLISSLFGGFSNLRHIIRRMMGWEKPTSSKYTSDKKSAYSSGSSSSRDYGSDSGAGTKKPHSGEKVFGQNEGTYVDFEEVKE